MARSTAIVYSDPHTLIKVCLSSSVSGLVEVCYNNKYNDRITYRNYGLAILIGWWLLLLIPIFGWFGMIGTKPLLNQSDAIAWGINYAQRRRLRLIKMEAQAEVLAEEARALEQASADMGMIA